MEGNVNLLEHLRAFGAPASGIISLDGPQPAPEQVPYLDLRASPRRAAIVDAVVEVEHRPVLYVVRGPLDPSETRRRCHLLAQRDQADYLGVIEPGRMTVFPAQLGELRPLPGPITVIHLWLE